MGSPQLIIFKYPTVWQLKIVWNDHTSAIHVWRPAILWQCLVYDELFVLDVWAGPVANSRRTLASFWHCADPYSSSNLRRTKLVTVMARKRICITQNVSRHQLQPSIFPLKVHSGPECETRAAVSKQISSPRAQPQVLQRCLAAYIRLQTNQRASTPRSVTIWLNAGLHEIWKS